MSQLEEGRAFVLKASAYAVLVALAALIAAYRGESLLATDAWLPFASLPRLAISLTLGALVAALVVGTTPWLLRQSSRARALHEDSRPAVRHASDSALLIVALASGVGEEIFFRGALVPWLGVLASSVLFGVLHQVRGSGRWVWVSWATAMGMVLALIFRASGHLAGCILAHVAVNAANLRFVRDYDGAPRARPLGGLLQRPRAPRPD